MTFKKEFHPMDFLICLSGEWERTTIIAERVGCSKSLTEDELFKLLELPDDAKGNDLRVWNVEVRKVRAGGRFSFAYEWRKLPVDK